MTDRMLQFFKYDHLPPHLQVASKPFCDLAHTIIDTYPSNPERTVTLRKLLETKDAAVRTILYKEEGQLDTLTKEDRSGKPPTPQGYPSKDVTETVRIDPPSHDYGGTKKED